MLLMRFRARLLAVAGLLAPASVAHAADAVPSPTTVVAAPAFEPVVPGCPDGCGPALGGWTGLRASGTRMGLFAPIRRCWQGIVGQLRPGCANSYPLSDWAYIRRFCAPTLIPGTCSGYFQTKWRKWEEHCPTQAGCATEYVFVSPPTTIVPGHQPLTPSQPQPMPVPKMDEPMKPKTDQSSRLPNRLPPLPVAAVAGLPLAPSVRTGR